jgi:lipoprotein-releasing system permease protein
MKKQSLAFHIARKYLFARKTYAIINIISGISVLGIAVATMALVVVLSVFNGFEDVILRLFNNFHSDFKIEAAIGKTFQLDDFPETSIRNINGVHTLTYVIEDLALARYDDRQHLVTVKAVSDEFLLSAKLDSIIVRGEAVLQHNGVHYAILGSVVDYVLGVNPNDYTKAVSLFVPKRTAKATVAMGQDFVYQSVYPSSVFSVQQEYDETHIIVPFALGQELYEYDNELTSIEIMCYPKTNLKQFAKKLEGVLGDDFTIKNRFQQQEFIYKILQSERLAIFLILSFILIIATFNVIGTLSMIILEKRKDIAVLHAMGAPLSFLRMLFVIEGLLVIIIGAILGVVMGLLLCWLQQQYGLLSLGGVEDAFVVQSYPVKIKISDIFIVLVTVFSIGLISSFIPSRRINETFASLNTHEQVEKQT